MTQEHWQVEERALVLYPNIEMWRKLLAMYKHMIGWILISATKLNWI
jgi:hypothetical protein